MTAIPVFGFFGLVGLLALLGQVFWLWMFVECLVKEPDDTNDKLLWGLVIFFGNLLGALLYFVVRRGERIERYGE